MSKHDRIKRRNRNRERQTKPQAIASPREYQPVQIVQTIDNRPTAERMRRGIWIVASRDEDAHIVIDRAVDMIGRLFATGQIDYAQHVAARQFQEIVDAGIAELGCTGYRSCLAGGIGGHDGDDGNPAAWRAYDAMKRRLGAVRFAFLRMETEKGPTEYPQDIAVLRRALDHFNGGEG